MVDNESRSPTHKKQKTHSICPVLTPNPNRFTLGHILYPDIWTLYKKQLACFWTAEEISWSQDLHDWKQLSSDQQHFIKHILAFFAASDGIVIENLVSNVCNKVQMPEARAFYGIQLAIENIHSEVYALSIETLIKDKAEKNRLFHAISTIPTIQKKADWALRWIQHSRKFGTLLVAFACVEGIMFSSSFAALFWLKSLGLMPGLTFSNELISRDEGLHTDFAVLLYHKLHSDHQIQPDYIHQIIQEAVDIEIEFATKALPVKLLGMNSTVMVEYIKFVADRLATQFNINKIYNIPECPLQCMKRISVNGKTNFFERKVSEYKLAQIENHEFSLTDDF